MPPQSSIAWKNSDGPVNTPATIHELNPQGIPAQAAVKEDHWLRRTDRTATRYLRARHSAESSPHYQPLLCEPVSDASAFSTRSYGTYLERKKPADDSDGEASERPRVCRQSMRLASRDFTAEVQGETSVMALVKTNATLRKRKKR